MVGSRHLQGTIVSRVSYLLKSGSLKKPPVWYDIVKRFPPPKTALLSLVADSAATEIPKIKYPDDDIKREFYEKYERAKRDPESLFSDIETVKTKTSFFLNHYHSNISNGCSHDDAMERSLETFRQYLLTLKDEKDDSTKKQSGHTIYKRDDVKSDLTSADIYDIFDRSSRK